MTKKRALLLVRIGEVPTEIEAEWNNWYDNRHLPSRLSNPGFVGARRFAVIGGESKGEYKYLTLSELENVDALTGENYLKLRDREASLPKDSFEAIILKLPNLARGVYEQIYPERGEYQIPNTEILLAVGHDVPSNRDDEYNAWCHTDHIPAMLNRVSGFIATRHLKLFETKLPPRAGGGYQSFSPKYVTLYDIENEKVFESEAFLREQNSPWSTWVRSWYSLCFCIIGRRISIIYPKRDSICLSSCSKT